jgi:hypothetical protein
MGGRGGLRTAALSAAPAQTACGVGIVLWSVISIIGPKVDPREAGMYKAGPQDRHGPHIQPTMTVSRA